MSPHRHSYAHTPSVSLEGGVVDAMTPCYQPDSRHRYPQLRPCRIAADSSSLTVARPQEPDNPDSDARLAVRACVEPGRQLPAQNPPMRSLQAGSISAAPVSALRRLIFHHATCPLAYRFECTPVTNGHMVNHRHLESTPLPAPEGRFSTTASTFPRYFVSAISIGEVPK